MATQYTAGITQGQVWTADIANQIGAAWETWTPTLKQGATTVTATVNYAKYARINKIVIVQLALGLTSAGAVNGIITVTYPPGLIPANLSGYRPLGNIVIHDSGTALYHSAAVVYDSTTFSGMSYNCVSYIGASTPAFTIANGDRFDAQLMYEVA